jgi:hypothetical protein
MADSRTSKIDCGDTERAAGITPEMMEAGIEALETGLSSRQDSSHLVCAVYLAMANAGEERLLPAGVREFATETIYNMRALVEDLARCERRASEHFARLSEASL